MCVYKMEMIAFLLRAFSPMIPGHNQEEESKKSEQFCATILIPNTSVPMYDVR